MNSTWNQSVPASNITYHDQPVQQVYETPAWLGVRVVLFALVISSSVIGNAVVCRAVCLIANRKLPFSYYLVTNLAIAEILSSLCYPFYLVYDSLRHWPFGSLGCKLVFPIQMMAMLVVTYTLAFIAVHRYRVIVAHRTHITCRKAMLLLGCLWFAAIALVSPLTLMHRIIELPSGVVWCVALLPGDKLGDSPRHTRFSIARFVLSFVVPYLVILVSYGGMALKLNHHIDRAVNNINGETPHETAAIQSRGMELEMQRRSLGNQPEGAFFQRTGAELKGNQNEYEKTKRIAADLKTPLTPHLTETPPGRGRTPKMNKKRVLSATEHEADLLRMIYAIILIFIACYIPGQVIFVYEQVRGLDEILQWPYYDLMRKYVFLLQCLPGALHPIVYGTISRFYGNAFAKLFLCK